MSSDINGENIESDQLKLVKLLPARKFWLLPGLIIILGLVFFFWWYFSQDHSIYAKLQSENYNKTIQLDNVVVSFKYPAVMKFNSFLTQQLGTKTDTPLVYSYEIKSNQNLELALTYLPIQSDLMLLGLSPSQLLNQIKNDTGDYITELNLRNTNLYNELYGNCNSYIENDANQTGLICINTVGSDTTIKIIGVSTTNQYTLTLAMPSSIWLAHQKVWQQVEKDFEY